MHYKSVVLASGSPRRKEILELSGIPFRVEIGNTDEQTTESRPDQLVQELARRKAEAVAVIHPNELVIGADTIVYADDRVLGKPKNRADAKNMLRIISGTEHEVFTGVAFCFEGETVTFYEKTEVSVYPLTDKEIEDYLSTAEPYDKAGSYAIQGQFARYIAGLNGDYHNVVGFPIGRIYQELKKRDLICLN